jgi:hypothetical protein
VIIGYQDKTASGVPITGELVDELAVKAEKGYDVEQMLQRRRSTLISSEQSGPKS